MTTDDLFENITLIIQQSLNLDSEILLIKAIKDDIFPLYKETFMFFIINMNNCINKFNTYLLMTYSYNDIIINMLEKARKETCKINFNGCGKWFKTNKCNEIIGSDDVFCLEN